MCVRVTHEYSCGHKEVQTASCANRKAGGGCTVSVRTVKHDEKCPHRASIRGAGLKIPPGLAIGKAFKKGWKAHKMGTDLTDRCGNYTIARYVLP